MEGGGEGTKTVSKEKLLCPYSPFSHLSQSRGKYERGMGDETNVQGAPGVSHRRRSMTLDWVVLPGPFQTSTSVGISNVLQERRIERKKIGLPVSFSLLRAKRNN